MYILKAILLYLIVAIFPGMLLYLSTTGFFQVLVMSCFFVFLGIIFMYSDKFILLFLGAREVIDADHHGFFQILKTESYREVEDLPRVYLYSGRRVKAFVLSLRSGWSIVLDRNLIKDLDSNQSRALIRYLISAKRKKTSKTQTLGMGISSLIIKLIYWLPEKFQLKPRSKFFKTFVFISFVMIKPLIEIILKLSVTREKIFCEDDLKPVYLKVDQSILSRTFIGFMLLHIEKNISLKDCIIEYLEGFPLLENCKFKEGLYEN